MAAIRGNGIRFGTRELSGAVADVGVLLPIAVALIVANGLSARSRSQRTSARTRSRQAHS
jgi:hypothetical protein